MDKNTGNGERKDNAKNNSSEKTKNEPAAEKDKAKEKSGNV